MCVDKAKNIVDILRRRPMTCAVINRDLEYRGLLAKVLCDLGFSVCLFQDSVEFWPEHRLRGFDLVVLDWEAPFVGCAGLVESIRGLGKPYPALIIEHTVGESVSFQLAIAPVGFLFKPFDAAHLMGVLEKAVRIRNES